MKRAMEDKACSEAEGPKYKAHGKHTWKTETEDPPGILKSTWYLCPGLQAHPKTMIGRQSS